MVDASRTLNLPVDTTLPWVKEWVALSRFPQGGQVKMSCPPGVEEGPKEHVEQGEQQRSTLPESTLLQGRRPM